MSNLLIDAGKALYGPRWQSELARALTHEGKPVSDRTMRRWVAGSEDLKPAIMLEIRALCLSRIDQLEQIAEQLSRRDRNQRLETK